MSNLSLLFACLACMGYGLRVQALSEELRSHPLAVTQNPSKALALLLTAPDSESAFSSPGSVAQFGNGVFSRRSVSPTMKLSASPVLKAAATLLLSIGLMAQPQPAEAARVVGEIAGSGLVFKDVLKVEAIDDPKVTGVNLYLSDFQRPVTEKLQKGDIFNDPSYGGLSCSRKGKVVVSVGASRDKGGEEVFNEARSLLTKSIKVRRLVDEEGGNVVYAVYTQRLNKDDDKNNSRFKSQLCAIPVDEFVKETAK